jgi:hypothetical protein
LIDTYISNTVEQAFSGVIWPHVTHHKIMSHLTNRHQSTTEWTHEYVQLSPLAYNSSIHVTYMWSIEFWGDLNPCHTSQVPCHTSQIGMRVPLYHPQAHVQSSPLAYNPSIHDICMWSIEFWGDLNPCHTSHVPMSHITNGDKGITVPPPSTCAVKLAGLCIIYSLYMHVIHRILERFEPMSHITCTMSHITNCGWGHRCMTHHDVVQLCPLGNKSYLHAK